MRTRNWIAVMSIFVLFATAAVVGHNAMAMADPKPELELNALSPVFPSGSLAELEVLVGPEALGGYAKLYASAGGETHEVLSFPIYEPGFILQAPVPSAPELLGRKLTFQYEAFSIDGQFLGKSKKADGLVVDPDIE